MSRSPVAPPTVAAAPAPSSLPGARDTVYVVERGDTTYAVARRFDIPVKSIIDANNLQPPYGLIAGARLTIPRPRAHLVAAGDTVQSVASRYGVDMSALVRVNDLQPPYALRAGQRLALPAPVAGAIQQAAIAPAPAPQPVVAIAPIPPPTGRPVEIGNLAPPPPPNAPPPIAPPVTTAPPPAPPAITTASSAPPPAPAAPPPSPPPAASAASASASSPPPSVATPVKPAPTAAPDKAPPAELAAPPPATSSPAATAVAPETAPAAAPQLAAIPAPRSDAVERPPGATPVEPAINAPPHDTTPVGPPPPRAGKTFAWPLRGRVISTYGEQGLGLHNDGINIAAPRGTPIKAAENGVVAYAGNEIRGFGNLLLIRHAGGYMTAYAHADSLLVKRGDTVHRGQTIARVGATGSVTEPQLHFEIREGSQPVDPQRFLGSPSA